MTSIAIARGGASPTSASRLWTKLKGVSGWRYASAGTPSAANYVICSYAHGAEGEANRSFASYSFIAGDSRGRSAWWA